MNGRTTLQYGLAAAFGVVVVCVVELTLQLAGAGPANTLFVESQVDGRTVFRANREAGHRYFQPQFRRDFASDVTFAAEKPADTVRIFVLGASTVVGFPNPPHVAFSRFLELMLTDVSPGTRFEVVNCGLTALSTFCLLDFMEEVVDYDPDLVILHAGHNEFVGPYGATTPFLSFGDDWHLIRLYMLLQRSKLYYYVKQLVFQTRLLFADAPARERFGLHLVDQEIGPGDPGYAATEANYRRNLQQMLSVARQRQVPVLLSTLISNVRDFYPLRSACIDDDVGTLVYEMEQLASRGRAEKAIETGEEASEQNPACANIQFVLGRLYLEQGEIAHARQALARARDLDRMPFRAPGSFNRTIRDLAATGEHVMHCDLEAAFAAASEHGLPGNELITEYLHPNPRGHHLIALELIRVMSSSTVGQRWGLSGALEGLENYDWYAERLDYSLPDQAYARNVLLRFLSDLPYRTPPATLKRYIAELVREQARIIPLLPSGTRRAFLRGGGMDLLMSMEEFLLPEDTDAKIGVRALRAGGY